MTPEQSTPDSLDDLLRQNETHVPDDGFTGRVMLSLPPRRADRWRRWLLFGALAAGAVLCAFLAPMIMGMTSAPAATEKDQWKNWLMLGSAVATVGLLIWGFVSVALEES